MEVSGKGEDMMRRKGLVTLVLALTLALFGCGSSSDSTSADSAGSEKDTSSVTSALSTETAEVSTSSELSEATGYTADLTIFAAKSLNGVCEELIKKYEEIQPSVKITGSYDSSGTLMTQIEQGAACDIFFSAAQKQMDQLEAEDVVETDSRANIVNNQVCVVTYKGSGTKVTGLNNLGDAASLALADGTVPVGKYTREALVASGVLPGTDDNSRITTQEISDALGGVTINECANVGAVTAAVSTGTNEVGTVYVSDTHGLEDKLDILEKVSYDLTGNVIYPAAVIRNPEASDDQKAAAADFVKFLKSDAAKALFEEYGFDTNV